MALDLEDHSLSGKLRVVILGEGDINVLLVSGFHAGDLLFKAGDKAVRPQLQTVIGPLASVKGLAIQEALEINDGGVALLGLPLHGHQTGVPVGEALEAAVHILGGDLNLLLGSGQALILAQGDLGIHGRDSLEGKALPGALAHQLHRRVAHYVELLLLHGGLIGVGEGDINRLVEKHLRAVHALNDLPGGLAGTETGDVDLSPHLPVRLFHGGLEFLGLHLNGQRDLALFDLFAALHTHVCFPPFIPGPFAPLQKS